MSNLVLQNNPIVSSSLNAPPQEQIVKFSHEAQSMTSWDGYTHDVD